jgi:hypothetical protein
MLTNTRNLIGITENNSIDTPLGKQICDIIVKYLNEIGYTAKYLNLENKINCKISLEVSTSNKNNLYFVKIMHKKSLTECGRNYIEYEEIEKWVEIATRYFEDNRII